MGLMRFHVAQVDCITEETVQQAYLSGIERVSWPVRPSFEGGCLVLQRAVSDPANLHLHWPVEGHGNVMLTTGNLVERPEPYLLPLELARGTIAQLRNHVSDSQIAGLTVPDTVHQKVAAAVQQFSKAAVTQRNPAVSARWAAGALRSALDAVNQLASGYSEQLLAARQTNGGVSAALGANLGTALLDDHTAMQVLQSFNAAEVPMCWRDTETTEENFTWATTDAQIEWCRTHGLRVLGGPLLMLASRMLPDWLCLFDDDFESLLHCVSSFVCAAVSRYRGSVHHWICAGRVNDSDVLALSEQEELRLVAQSIELVRSLDPRTPTIVSFDQPWAEYMSRRHSDFPPLHFADVLARSNLNLGGLMLEVNLGFHPGGTLARHPLEFSRQLDMWSQIGLPLWISISAPSDCHDDPLAQRQVSISRGGWTPAAQQAWVAQFVPLILAKPMVQGVVWNQLCDSLPHEFPHGGLFDHQSQAKPALRTLASIRQTYLKG